jgi:dephospho-CoA kinase
VNKNRRHKIFAIVGMCGAGKSIACDVLCDLGWHYIRFGQITMDKLKEQGIPVTAENEKIMRESLRKEYGMAAFALLSLDKIDEKYKSGNVVIDGLYSWSEYKILKERYRDSLTVVCIHASPGTRYKRLENRHMHECDTHVRMRPLTKEQAKIRDYAEIENIEKGGPIAMADRMIVNEAGEDELRKKMKELANET